MATASLASAATLRVDAATAQVGGSARVAVSLDNPGDDVRALQFSLGALPAGVQFVGAEASGRAVGLTAAAEPQPDGRVKVVLISLGAQTVPAGTGPVLDLHFAVKDTGSASAALMPMEVVVAGTTGALDATGQGGQLDVEAGSAAPASSGSCAISPTRSERSLWFALVFAAAWLIAGSIRRAASPTRRLWAILIFMATSCLLTPFHARPAQAGWVQLDGGGVPRAGMGCAYDSARGRGVSFGGDDSGWIQQNDTYEWDGATWTLVASQGLPPRTSLTAGMVFDGARRKSLLFGGWVRPDSYYGDTWAWDGARWQQVSTSGPPTRANHAMAYDSSRQRVVLFGGAYYQTIRGDTWEWDGSSWKQLNSSGPSPRMFPNMAYDAARGKVVLFGGQTHYRGTFLNDTWQWDGTSWEQVASTGPAARSWHMMTYDPLRQRVVLFGGGGWGISQRFGDTWEWDGSSWTQIIGDGPPARQDACMFFDETRGSVVLYGGDTMQGDTWEFCNPCTSATATPTPTPTGPAPNVTLRVGNATTAPGQQRVAIPIFLTNNVAVRALQFVLTDTPNQVTLSAAPVCTTTSRSSALSCDCNETGGVIRCVLLSTGAGTIAAGSGQVATVSVDDTAPSCTAGQTIQLNLSDTAVADASNNPLSHTTVNGSLHCGCPEDLNCDTQVNIFDAVICVDLILGRNPPRCADADLDGSGRTDIFDCLLIVDTILGRRPGCSVPPITPGTATATATGNRTATHTNTPNIPRTPTPAATATGTAGLPTSTATVGGTAVRTNTRTPTPTATWTAAPPPEDVLMPQAVVLARGVVPGASVNLTALLNDATLGAQHIGDYAVWHKPLSAFDSHPTRCCLFTEPFPDTVLLTFALSGAGSFYFGAGGPLPDVLSAVGTFYHYYVDWPSYVGIWDGPGCPNECSKDEGVYEPRDIGLVAMGWRELA
jgi:hypothetical protein